MKQPLLLASSSPFRQALLAKLGLPFTCASPDIDESALPGESAGQLVVRLAQQKALALAGNAPDTLIIGSDQVGSLNGHFLGKPNTAEKAYQQLRAASGQSVTFYTGLTLYCSRRRQFWQCCETFQVNFRQLRDEEIEAYIAREQPLNCAGSFKSEGLGITLFDSLQGRDPNTLVGLPLIALCEFLREAGLDPLTSL
ncbi:Maf family protein [Tatumella citrea]|uniref:7-methyl-GTP pyrophosphatase n=1 Tax=Tatumella citrea TaxID=53336 RepID=A0A1Y0LJJ9_TATCI|nr:nucleoside triphosphate pyrophosphatase [Tatumella citrea]ARU93640.1 septum formation protein Maf [Tatumella citrea]ARU97678.1 septum formation protein Maf [Tatumella citrea]